MRACACACACVPSRCDIFNHVHTPFMSLLTVHQSTKQLCKRSVYTVIGLIIGHFNRVLSALRGFTLSYLSNLARLNLPFSQTSSFVSSSAARPMLSFVITRLIMSCDPSALAIASWLNSTRCSLTSVNLQRSKSMPWLPAYWVRC